MYASKAARKSRATACLRLGSSSTINDRFMRQVVGEEYGLAAAFIYSKTSPFAQELQKELPGLEEKLNQY